jgi:hypothetical protein
MLLSLTLLVLILSRDVRFLIIKSSGVLVTTPDLYSVDPGPDSLPHAGYLNWGFFLDFKSPLRKFWNSTQN